MAREEIQIDGETYWILTGVDADRRVELYTRIARLVRERGMTYRAAKIVVEKAMALRD